MTDLVLKQFISCILLAFTAVVAIHLTHHHSGVNAELTIAYNLFTGQRFLVSFCSHGVFYIEGVKAKFLLWLFLIIFTKQLTNSGLKIKK